MSTLDRDASASEADLFRKLSNPIRVNFNKDVRRQAAYQPPAFNVRSHDHGRRLGGRGDDEHSDEEEEDDEEEETSEEEDSDDDEEEHVASPPPAASGPAVIMAPPSFGNQSQIGSAVAGSVAVRGEIEREKQEYLFELNNMAAEGSVRLTRRYSMADSLADISYEYQRQKEMMRTRRHVVMIRNGLEVTLNLAAGANRKFGPVLDLDGWEQQLHQDMHVEKKYDDVLERLYKKHWRRGSTSPEMELAWLVGSSAVGYHIKRKCGFTPSLGRGGGGGGMAAPPPPPAGGAGLSGLFGSVMRGMMGGGAPRPPPPTTGPPRRSQTTNRGPVMPPPGGAGRPFSVPPAAPVPATPSVVATPASPQQEPRDVRAAAAEARLRAFATAEQDPASGPEIIFDGATLSADT